MRPTLLTSLLIQAIDHRLPVLITGKPGIGKSDLVSQAAQGCDADIIISHPVVSDPTDAKGLPWIAKDKEHATFLPFGELAHALKATKPTVWFLDDLGQASPAVQASFMQLLLARRVNGHVLPDCVTFVAATNDRTHKAGVSGLLEPVKSRFTTIIELEAHLDDWCSWAIDAGLPVEVIGFLRFRPGLLSDFKPTQDMKNSPSPRTWSSVAKLLALDLPQSILLEAVQGAVGEGAAAEFMAYLQIVSNLPNLDAILLNPDTANLPDEKPAVKYAVSVGLAHKATKQNFDGLATYANRMEQAGMGEFAVLMLRDAVRRDPQLCNTLAYTKLATGKLGKLIAG